MLVLLNFRYSGIWSLEVYSWVSLAEIPTLELLPGLLHCSQSVQTSQMEGSFPGHIFLAIFGFPLSICFPCSLATFQRASRFSADSLRFIDFGWFASLLLSCEGSQKSSSYLWRLDFQSFTMSHVFPWTLHWHYLGSRISRQELDVHWGIHQRHWVADNVQRFPWAIRLQSC